MSNNQVAQVQYIVPKDDTNISGLEDEQLKGYLNHRTLERNPESFKLILEEIRDRDLPVADIINNTSIYEIWFSTLMHCVVFLTGSLIKNNTLSDTEYDFYGAQHSIPDSLGVEILDLLVELGGNLNIQNYYYETAFDFYNYDEFKETLTAREDNDMLINRITWLYHNHNPDDHDFVEFI